MARRKQLLQQVGIVPYPYILNSPEGAIGPTPVFKGLYRFSETEGIDLPSLLIIFREKGWGVCWTSYYEEALEAGMKHGRVMVRLEMAIADAYGPSHRDVVIERLRACERASEHPLGQHEQPQREPASEPPS